MLLETIFIAAAWICFTGEPSWENLIFGATIGYLSLRLVESHRPMSWQFLRKAPQFLGLSIYFIWELIVANLRIARAVLGDPKKLRPAIVAIPLDADSEDQIFVLANLITLTPGTLSVDVSTDQKTLYVHCADCPDPDAMRDEIKSGFERRVREVYA